VTSVDGVGYTWEDDGNRLDDGQRSYTYDAANRLVEVVSGSAPVVGEATKPAWTDVQTVIYSVRVRLSLPPGPVAVKLTVQTPVAV
jgi:hypothetical protein